MEVIDTLDTQRFMGTWYVIAHVPPFLTKNAYNAVERYRLNEDGNVDVLFTYNEGSFDGDLKTMTPTGFPDAGDEEGVWGMRLVWPFKADYRIVHLDDDYTETIVAREKRDYAWIMARTPKIAAERYKHMAQILVGLGYEPDKLREVPQQSLETRQTPVVAKEFDAASANAARVVG